MRHVRCRVGHQDQDVVTAGAVVIEHLHLHVSGQTGERDPFPCQTHDGRVVELMRQVARTTEDRQFGCRGVRALFHEQQVRASIADVAEDVAELIGQRPKRTIEDQFGSLIDPVD